MQRWRWWLAVVMVSSCGSLQGCGGSAEAPPTTSQSQREPEAPSGTAQTATSQAAETPAASVHRFLEAVRTGDEDTAASLLTPIARQKTQEMDMVVAPPGSDTARFEIGEVELIEADLAHVASRWTDIDEQGEAHTDDIVWCLRRLPQGWRVAGMATKVFDDQPPLLLNFEDPDDMLRKQQMVEAEIRRRATAAQQGASAPATAQQPAATGGQFQR